MFNEEIEFYYPGRDILRASDGQWVIERSLTLQDSYVDVSPYLYNRVVGSTSGAAASIDRIVSTTVNGVPKYELYITNILGTFQAGEYLKDSDTGTFLGKINSDGQKTYDGRYVSTRGFLSNDKYLQDNYYYQEYSYVIRSGQSPLDYEKAVLKLTHPAGTKMFPQVVTEIEINAQPEAQSVAYNTQQGFEIEIDLSLYFSVNLEAGYSDAELIGYSGVFVLEKALETGITVTNSLVSQNNVPVGDVTLLTNTTGSYYASNTLSEFANVSVSDFLNRRVFYDTSASDLASYMDDKTIMLVIDSGNSANAYYFKRRCFRKQRCYIVEFVCLHVRKRCPACWLLNLIKTKYNIGNPFRKDQNGWYYNKKIQIA